MGTDTLEQLTLFDDEYKKDKIKIKHSKECVSCKKELPLSKMKKVGFVGKQKDGIYKWYLGKKCKECNNKEAKEGKKARMKFPYPKDKNYKCPICRKDADTLLNSYAIVDKDYNVYEGVLKKPFVLDHNHVTGKVRGYLCNSCNTGLGKIGDSVERLERATKYSKGELNGSTGI